MRGLVYKENLIFFKSIDKKLFLLIAGAIAALIYSVGVYAGLLASVMLAITIGMQNILSFVNDEKADWKKYQMAMPVSTFSIIRAKYISVVCTAAISLMGSLLFNLLTSIIFRDVNLSVWGASAAASFIIPLFWTGIGLPLTYWFGFRSAQVMGLVATAPIFYLIKYFEEEAGFTAMSDSMLSYAAVIGLATAAFFLLSMLISVIGYNRKK